MLLNIEHILSMTIKSVNCTNKSIKTTHCYTKQQSLFVTKKQNFARKAKNFMTSSVASYIKKNDETTSFPTLPLFYLAIFFCKKLCLWLLKF